MKRALVIMNRRSGSASSLEELGELVNGTLRARGVEPDLQLVEPCDLGPALASAERASTDLLVIGGGDGSVRCAAARAMEIGVPLAVLPLGTMNLVAKDFGVPLNGREAAEALVSGQPVEVDVGEVNGRLFLHSAVLGIVPKMGSEREQLRGRRDLRALADFGGRVWRIVMRERPFRAAIEFDGERRRVATFMIAVTANRLRMMAPGALTRESLGAGELGVYWATHQSRAGLIQLLGELGTGLWGLDDRVERHACEGVVIRLAQRRVLMSTDGELTRVSSPLRFRVRKNALQVLVSPRIAEHLADA